MATRYDLFHDFDSLCGWSITNFHFRPPEEPIRTPLVPVPVAFLDAPFLQRLRRAACTTRRDEVPRLDLPIFVCYVVAHFLVFSQSKATSTRRFIDACCSDAVLRVRDTAKRVARSYSYNMWQLGRDGACGGGVVVWQHRIQVTAGGGCEPGMRKVSCIFVSTPLFSSTSTGGSGRDGGQSCPPSSPYTDPLNPNDAPTGIPTNAPTNVLSTTPPTTQH